MQKLIMLTGEAWTGKSTFAKLLYREYENSAWLDGDDVWKVNPFTVTDPRLRNSDLNMAFVVDNYLKSKFDYVFFSSIVLCNEYIRNRILDLITYEDYELIFITFHATEEVLRKRARKRDDNLNPKFVFLEDSLKQDSIFIDTSEGNKDEILSKIKEAICRDDYIH